MKTYLNIIRIVAVCLVLAVSALAQTAPSPNPAPSVSPAKREAASEPKSEALPMSPELAQQWAGLSKELKELQAGLQANQEQARQAELFLANFRAAQNRLDAISNARSAIAFKLAAEAKLAPAEIEITDTGVNKKPPEPKQTAAKQ